MNFDRKKQIRFKNDDDIRPLREVVARNPIKNKNKWTEVATVLSTPMFVLDARRVRERTNLLIEQHKRENRENLKRYFKRWIYPPPKHREREIDRQTVRIIVSLFLSITHAHIHNSQNKSLLFLILFRSMKRV